MAKSAPPRMPAGSAAVYLPIGVVCRVYAAAFDEVIEWEHQAPRARDGVVTVSL